MARLGPRRTRFLSSTLVIFLVAPTLDLFCGHSGLGGRGAAGGGRSAFARAEPGVGRWGQSSFLLNPDDSPTLIVVSGKSFVAGQTATSCPTTDTSLLLSLASPISDLSSPNWTSFAGPLAQFSSSVALSASAALTFGGDATGSTTSVVQTLNDSSWLLSLPKSSASLAPTWTQQSTLWANEPERRQEAFAASATNGTASRAWVFGGLKADGSGTAYNELWELGLSVGSGGAVSLGGGWAMGSVGPPAMYDGTAVLVPSDAGGEPSIYLVGGVQYEAGTTTIASLADVWVFTPTTALAGGSWTQLATTNAPAGRRGHVALDIGSGKIWIQGGRSEDQSSVFSDAAVLDTRTRAWTTVAAGAQVWGHSAALVGSTVVVAFGYGTNSPASSDLSVYAPGNDTWLSSYHPSFVTTSAGSTSSDSTSRFNPTATGTAIATSNTRKPPANPKESSFPSRSAGGWSIPGAAPSTTAGSINSPGGPDSGSSIGGPKSNKSVDSKVIGGAVGGVLAAAAVTVGLLLVRRRRRRGMYAPGSRRARGGWHADRGEGSGSLMAEHRQPGSYVVEEAVPVAMRTACRPVGAGVRNALSGILGRSTIAAGSARFDMLRDEESERGDSPRNGRNGWETFADADAAELSVDMSGRGGLGVWSGFGDPSGRSDTVQTRGSFLTGALGAFVSADAGATPSREERALFEDDGYGGHDLGRQAPNELDPIHEWDEEHDASSLNSTSNQRSTTETRSTDSHPSRLSVPLSTSSNPRSTSGSSSGSSGRNLVAPPNVSPFASPSRALSLPPSGSRFGFPRSSDTSPSSSLHHSNSTTTTDMGRLRRTSTWWSRLSKPPAGEIPTSTATVRIRDPTPAPPLGAIEETPDPFADSNASDAERPTRRHLADEQGWLPQREVRQEHSQSSTGTLDTISSSILEERMREMDVVQRVQTGSLTGSEVSFSPAPQHGFTRVPSHSHDETAAAPGPFVWNGQGGVASSQQLPRTASPDPFTDPYSTPRKVVVGPRPLSPYKAPTPLSPTLTGTPTSGVKALIHRIETGGLADSTPTSSRPPSAAASPATPRSTAFPNVRKVTLEFEKPPGPSTPSPTRVVRHGLAKKPRLYVANPDGSEGD